MSVQAPGAVLLIRPHQFVPNPETASDNSFQFTGNLIKPDRIAAAAYEEVTGLGQSLTQAGVMVHMFDDQESSRPDSVFPNNWLSTHSEGRIGVFPMYASNRRTERRTDILDYLKSKYHVQEVIDYSGFEVDNVFLEGTGAMVLDHAERVAYVAQSKRMNPIALERFCTSFGYEPLAFEAIDSDGVPVYHTNVLMSVASNFSLVGMEMIGPESRQRQIRERLSSRGRCLIELTRHQVHEFAGNAIELQGSSERLFVLSRRALASLTTYQKHVIEQSCRLLPVDVPTIELAGGSVRCMIAGIHLSPRHARVDTQGHQALGLPATSGRS